MFINLSNHPSAGWSADQKNAAREYGEITDISFPNIDPHMDEEDVSALADQYYEKIMKYPEPAVMLQGEFTFTFALASRLRRAGVTVLAACSERNVTTTVKEDGTQEKRIRFEFVRFRKYE